MFRRKDLNDELMKTINKFKLGEIVDLVLPEFPDVSWAAMKAKLVKGKAYLNVSTVKSELLKKSKKLSNEELQDKLFNLQMTYNVHHNEKRNWHTYKMLGDPNEYNEPYIPLAKKLTRACRLQHIECIVRERLHDGILWFMVVVKKVKPKVSYNNPIYCAHFIGDSYFFFHSQRISAELLKAFVKCFHFDDITKYSLEGHHIPSLYRLLKNKESHTFGMRSIQQHPTDYKPGKGRATRGGINFTQNENRLQYVEECLGDDHPKLQVFSVSAKNCSWQGTTAIPEMEGQKVNCRLTLKSNNISDMVKSMAEQGILSPPLASVFRRLPTLGKNMITMREID